MNLVLLSFGLRAHRRPPLQAVMLLLGACAVLTIEMQAAALLGIGTLRTVLGLNAGLALAALRWYRPAPAAPADTGSTALPWLAISALLALVLGLNLTMPLEGADPYHLQRVAQIERLGTLAYDPAAEIKVNALATVYELVLADVRLIPIAGPWLVQVHGAIGLLFYVLTVAAIRPWFSGGPVWVWAVMFAAPVLFHQFVLVKNDLFGAVPVLLVLCWLVKRGGTAPRREVFWAALLTGFAVGIKLISFPLSIVLVAATLLARQDRAATLATLAAGGLAGAVAGGVPFNLYETARTYGDPLTPLGALGNRNASIADVVTSILRFAISLVDFGVFTRLWWPGRGGWGATFGAPLLWALAVLAIRARAHDAAEREERLEARRALALSGAYFAAFAAVYPDADIGHRLVLAPGLLLMAVAAHMSGGDDAGSVWMRRALLATLALSAAQVLRSAWLYAAA
jgi:hypothetical protein